MNILPRKPPTCDDLDILAKTIYGEARGEGDLGREAVGGTIINRWQSGKWFNGKDINNDGFESIAEVCQQPWQFSCWNENDPNRQKLLELNLYDNIFRDCLTTSLLVIANSADTQWAGRDKSNGATHYFADYIATPKWAVGKTPCAIIGHHRFFRNIN